MCGIIGMAGNLQTAHTKMFRDMLVFDAVRGIDSTGIVHVPMKHGTTLQPVKYDKELGLPDNLWVDGNSKILDDKGVPKNLGRVLIGHNRAATSGKVTVDGAHPFIFDDLYGVHNGTLRNYVDLEGYHKHDIDSMCLYDHIAQHGIADAWLSFTGAAACVWWDDKAQSLNIIRNSERPLYVAYNANNDVMFWASESWMIHAAAGRRHVKLLTKKNEKDEEVTVMNYFSPDHHYSYEVMNNGFKMLGMEELEKKQITQPTGMANGYTNGSFNNGYTQTPGVRPPTNNRPAYHVKGKKGKRRQLNVGWAKDMKRADKDSRGVKFTITHEIESGLRFMGRIESKDPSLQGGFVTIYPNSDAEIEKLRHAIKNNNTRFKSVARLRYKEKSNYTIWGVSSTGIKPILGVIKDNTNHFEESIEDEEPENLYKAFANLYVDEANWYKYLEESGCTCAWCSDVLDIKDHKEILFFDKEDALCPDCATNPTVLGHLAEIYPEVRSKRYAN